MNDIEAVLKGLVVEIGGASAESVGRGTRLIDDLHLDSVQLVELVVAIEESFGLDGIDNESTRSIRTFGQLCDFVAAEVDSQGIGLRG